MKNNDFKIHFNSSEQSFKPKFSRVSTETKPKVEITKNNNFKTQFNSSEQSFKSKFSQKPIETKPQVEPKAESVEDVYYDEIVFYDGGGVDGYGNS